MAQPETFFPYTVLANTAYARPFDRGFVRLAMPVSMESSPLPEIFEWCIENCRANYFNDSMRFYFESQRDAALFKVRYG